QVETEIPTRRSGGGVRRQPPVVGGRVSLGQDGRCHLRIQPDAGCPAGVPDSGRVSSATVTQAFGDAVAVAAALGPPSCNCSSYSLRMSSPPPLRQVAMRSSRDEIGLRPWMMSFT